MRVLHVRMCVCVSKCLKGHRKDTSIVECLTVRVCVGVLCVCVCVKMVCVFVCVRALGRHLS